jgi:tetratricopeptide (TPR) repeat protein
MDTDDPAAPKKPVGLLRLYENVTVYESGGGDEADEISQLRGMLDKNPESHDIKEWLAFKLYSAGDTAEAERFFRDLIAADHRAGVQYFYLGNLLAKQGRKHEAIDCWTKTVELLPNDVKAKKAAARIRKATAIP